MKKPSISSNYLKSKFPLACGSVKKTGCKQIIKKEIDQDVEVEGQLAAEKFLAWKFQMEEEVNDLKEQINQNMQIADEQLIEEINRQANVEIEHNTEVKNLLTTIAELKEVLENQSKQLSERSIQLEENDSLIEKMKKIIEENQSTCKSKDEELNELKEQLKWNKSIANEEMTNQTEVHLKKEAKLEEEINNLRSIIACNESYKSCDLRVECFTTLEEIISDMELGVSKCQEVESEDVKRECDAGAPMKDQTVQLEVRLAQKQEMILLLQSELSEHEVEAVECSTKLKTLIEQLEQEQILNHTLAKTNEILIDENNSLKTILAENSKTENTCWEMSQKINDLEQANEFLQNSKLQLDSMYACAIKKAEAQHVTLVSEIFLAAEQLRLAEHELGECKRDSTTHIHKLNEMIKKIEEDLRSVTLNRDELRVANVGNHLTIVELQDKIDTVTADLNKEKVDNQRKLISADENAEEIRQKCLRYVVANSNLLSSLNAVSEFLAQSLCNEKNLKEIELNLKTKVVQLSEIIQVQKQSLDSLEAANIREIEEVRTTLLQKVNELSQVMEERAEELSNTKRKEDAFIAELSAEVDKLSSRIQISQTLVDTFEQLNQQLEREKLTLTNQLSEVKESFISLSESFMQLKECTNNQVKELHNNVLQLDVESLAVLNLLGISNLNTPKVDRPVSEENVKIESINQHMVQVVQNLSSIKSFIKRTNNNIMSLVGSFDIKSCEASQHCAHNLNCVHHAVSFLVKELQSERARASKQCKSATLELEQTLHNLMEQNIHTKSHFDSVRASFERDIAHLNEEAMRKENVNLQLLQEINVLQKKSATDQKLVVELKHRLRTKTEEVTKLSADDWHTRFTELELLVSPFRQQLEEFETERKALESKKEAADNEVKTLAEKYADILGHQNHKQKIKHVIKLKQQNLELKQDNESFEIKLRQRNKVIEKLRAELASYSSRNPKHHSGVAPAPLKENSPVRAPFHRHHQ